MGMLTMQEINTLKDRQGQFTGRSLVEQLHLFVLLCWRRNFALELHKIRRRAALRDQSCVVNINKRL